METQKNIDKIMNYTAGAVYALLAGILGEFSAKGNSGIVEIRVENGKLLGVHVAKFEPAPAKSITGVRVGWQMTPEDIANVQ